MTPAEVSLLSFRFVFSIPKGLIKLSSYSDYIPLSSN